MEQRAENAAIAARSASLVLTVGLLAAVGFIWARTGPAVPGALALLNLVILISPLGTYLSVFTMWSGYWVRSLPDSPEFEVRTLEVVRMRCHECDTVAWAVEPVVGPTGWVQCSPEGSEPFDLCPDCAGWRA
jgi:hypothetical protein